MTDNSNHHLARQFVDMWQKQLSDMLVDEKFVANIIDMMHQPGGFPHAATTTNTANATVSPDAANAVVGQLERRLAQAEGRLAELEREMAGLRRQMADAANRQHRPASRRKRGVDKA